MAKKQYAKLFEFAEAEAETPQGVRRGARKGLSSSNGTLRSHEHLNAGVRGIPLSAHAAVHTELGALVIGDCLESLSKIPDGS